MLFSGPLTLNAVEDNTMSPVWTAGFGKNSQINCEGEDFDFGAYVG